MPWTPLLISRPALSISLTSVRPARPCEAVGQRGFGWRLAGEAPRCQLSLRPLHKINFSDKPGGSDVAPEAGHDCHLHALRTHTGTHCGRHVVEPELMSDHLFEGIAVGVAL